MAEEFDFHPMWESLGMNLADHDMLLGAVGQMYGDMFLTCLLYTSDAADEL